MAQDEEEWEAYSRLYDESVRRVRRAFPYSQAYSAPALFQVPASIKRDFLAGSELPDSIIVCQTEDKAESERTLEQDMVARGGDDGEPTKLRSGFEELYEGQHGEQMRELQKERVHRFVFGDLGPQWFWV